MLKISFFTKFTFWKPRFLKIHNSKMSFFTKFTFWTSQFSQNSHSKNVVFHKIHILTSRLFAKFTFWKSQFSTNSHFENLIWKLFLTTRILLQIMRQPDLWSTPTMSRLQGEKPKASASLSFPPLRDRAQRSAGSLAVVRPNGAADSTLATGF